ncbi:MAG: hypothetical protein QNJ00_11670 [Woeseiaceae bacterium]|nr:hypothetical protein [Woeseiaceae bacterium]
MLLLASIAACAASNKKPDVPYPAYVVSDDLPDIFLAALPGVRAKEYTSDMRTRSTSNRVDLPADWSGTTGGAPGKSIEIFVLDGTLSFSDFELGPGGYAYVPPGSLGFRLETEGGARILYALDDVDDSSVIRTPIILDSDLVAWTERSPGYYEKELRKDPGSGARTWLERIDPGVAIPLTSSSAAREGYLVLGQYQHAECVDGLPEAGEYLPGGYFRRPEGAVNGGAGSAAVVSSVWFLRERKEGEVSPQTTCPPKVEVPED